ncbi:bifunctional riboflavin kinase/FAD synthetase [Propioniciclava sp. MC1595]|uniref:bifunctional riboflavin kinase/FAD synthetase n=1 Tax=Propioniciclava sp. MC1595 TaxID=2760308 RepID=UPI00166230D8|nr:bifunctional riboflavin kinase/FAD synthetase [Propioniciclava sp. MC1595]MBB1493871.1 bifunctional riboflavin kinase/FAD synthetase [Propioniciclava sp. MC1595]QTE24940.1 bifunctional riboflavin kinase/FAD synthetase [Propioniciclava sp. MC1595]
MTRSVVVIGNFDGVHPGHQQVLAAARKAEPGAPLVVVTFWPHPMAVIRPDGAPKLLTNLEDRVALLRRAGADEVRVLEFTRELSQQSPEQFVEQHLLPLDPVRIVVGENFRFGHRASGTVGTLADLGRGRFEVTGLPLVHVGDEETCSSAVREALEAGDVRHAAELLGRPFRFRGSVSHGDKRGRELGFPTANLPVPKEYACPADGVYAGWVTRLDGLDAHGAPLPDGQEAPTWPAAISVGSNPTFDGHDRRVESFVLDRDDLELYDAPIAVDFCARIRGQVKFTGIEALIEQMDADVAAVRTALAEHPCR